MRSFAPLPRMLSELLVPRTYSIDESVSVLPSGGTVPPHWWKARPSTRSTVTLPGLNR